MLFLVAKIIVTALVVGVCYVVAGFLCYVLYYDYRDVETEADLGDNFAIAFIVFLAGILASYPVFLYPLLWTWR